MNDPALEEFRRLIEAAAAQPDPTAASVELLLGQLEPGRARLLRLCAIPHAFNPAILRTLAPELDEETARRRCEELAQLSIVVSGHVGAKEDLYAVHDQARRYLFCSWLKHEASEERREVSRRLVALIDGQLQQVAEHGGERDALERSRMFHMLGTDQRLGLDEFERLTAMAVRHLQLGEVDSLVALAREYDPVLAAGERTRISYWQGVADRALQRPPKQAQSELQQPEPPPVIPTEGGRDLRTVLDIPHLRSNATEQARRSIVVTVRIISVVGTCLLARYLAPAEYGDVTAAMIVTLTVFRAIMPDFLTTDLEREQVFHATCWSFATGIAALGITWGLSRLLGVWVQAPDLVRYLPTIAASALLDRIAFVPEGILFGRQRLGRILLSHAAGELTFTALSLTLAALGVGAMALAWANLARAALRAAVIVAAVSWRDWLEPHRLRMAVLGPMVRSSIRVSVGSIAASVIRYWDKLLVSRYFGNATMGAYNQAYGIAEAPAVIGEPMSHDTASAFLYLDPRKRRHDALIRAFAKTARVMLPLAFGLGAVSETVVQAFFNRRWADIGPMLMCLSILSAPRSMTELIQWYLYREGRRVVQWLQWLSFGALMAAIIAFGSVLRGRANADDTAILWTCGAVGAVFVAHTLALLWAVKRLDGIPLRRFFIPLIRPLVACAAMVGAVLGARPVLPDVTPLATLTLEVALATTVYLAIAGVISRNAIAESLAVIRSIIPRR